MKTSIAILTTALLSNIIVAQTTTIPDINFEKALIALGYDTGTPDGKVLTANIDTVQTLIIDDKGIRSLSGLEDFTVLGRLECSNNPLDSLVISKNSQLYGLICNDCQLSSLDVSKNTFLNVLECSNNQLTVLDVSKNSYLETLNCLRNQLTNLDVSKNTRLEYLECYSNQLTSLDVSKNPDLWELNCDSNQLTSLDISQNTALELLVCSNNKLTSLDISKNDELWEFFFSNNQLTSLNLKNGNNGFDILDGRGNPDLKCVNVDNPRDAKEDWTRSFDPGVRFSRDCSVLVTDNMDNLSTSHKSLLYPNPTKGAVNIELREENGTWLHATLRNQIGQIVLSQKFENMDNISLNIEAAKGIYFLTLETEIGESKFIKVIKE